MEKPKYKIGDTVWRMENNLPRAIQVVAIVELDGKTLYGLGGNVPKEWYKHAFWGKLAHKLTVLKPISSQVFYEDIPLHSTEQIFPTKQSLIDSL